MTTVRYVGDIHGEVDKYVEQVGDAELSVQIGDFGIGFRYGRDQILNGSVAYPASAYVHTPQHYLDPTKHRFIRGNHDDPSESRAVAGNIADGSYEMIDGHKVLYIGGARSIDAAQRVENQSWWRDEELNQAQLNDLIDRAMVEQPEVMITHEAPEFLVSMLQLKSMVKGNFPSITRQAFEALLYYTKPKLWIFGHWHQSLDYSYKGTRFICLDILETIDINYTDLERIN